MSKSKVVIPKYVADAIEILRSQGNNNYETLNLIKGAVVSEVLIKANGWTMNEGSTDLLMEALINGYEVEKTPEEELAERFIGLNEVYHSETNMQVKENINAEIYGIFRTLDILGITIEGINEEDG